MAGLVGMRGVSSDGNRGFIASMELQVGVKALQDATGIIRSEHSPFRLVCEVLASIKLSFSELYSTNFINP